MLDHDVLGFSGSKAWDYENGFYLTSNATRIAKLLAHYELYKMILGLPGHIVECGVFKGASLVRLATFRSLLESQDSRRLIGFDAFGRFPRPAGSADREFAERFESAAGQGVPEADLTAVLENKGFSNFELVPGDINSTIPRYCREHPEMRLSLLHIDVDVYEPSVTALRELYPRLVPGGLLILDDYGTVAGETVAFEEYFAGQSVRLSKLPISHIPAFVVKDQTFAVARSLEHEANPDE